MAVLDRLFAFPSPTMQTMLTQGKGKTPYAEGVRRIAHVLELLECYFEVMDAGYGQRAKSTNVLEFRA